MSWGFVAVGGAVVASSLIASNASRSAANTQADAAQNATAAQLEMYYQSRDDLARFREAGEKAIGELEKQVLAGPGEFKPEEQPGYKFGYKEFVEKPLLQNASATGKLRSGNILRTLSDRASDYASLSYDNWLNRWLTRIQPLQSLAGIGQTSSSTTAGLGVQTGQGMAQNILAGGQAQAGGAINQANALTGGIRGGSSLLMDYLLMSKTGSGSLYPPGGFEGPRYST